MTPSREDMVVAVTKRREAKALEARAKKLSDEARSVIMAYAEAHPEEFVVAEDSESGKTVAWRDDDKCRITTPTKKDLPDRFDHSRTDEFRFKLLDLFGDSYLFYFDVSYWFNEDRWVRDMSSPLKDADLRRRLTETILPFILPAEKGSPMTPRVEVK